MPDVRPDFFRRAGRLNPTPNSPGLTATPVLFIFSVLVAPSCASWNFYSNTGIVLRRRCSPQGDFPGGEFSNEAFGTF